MVDGATIEAMWQTNWGMTQSERCVRNAERSSNNAEWCWCDWQTVGQAESVARADKRCVRQSEAVAWADKRCMRQSEAVARANKRCMRQSDAVAWADDWSVRNGVAGANDAGWCDDAMAQAQWWCYHTACIAYTKNATFLLFLFGAIDGHSRSSTNK